MLEKIAQIIADYKDSDPSEVKPESNFKDLGIDSLDTVELIMNVEDEFGVSIEMSPDIQTVGDLMKIIEAQQ